MTEGGKVQVIKFEYIRRRDHMGTSHELIALINTSENFLKPSKQSKLLNFLNAKTNCVVSKKIESQCSE